MADARLSRGYLKEIEGLGMDPERVFEQLRFFESPPPPMRLLRPCTVGDGILRVDPQHFKRLIELHQKAASKGRFTKFVPASGAATRMFKLLHKFHTTPPIPYDQIRENARKGERECAQFVRFLGDIHKFAFFDDLKASLARDGWQLEGLLSEGRYEVILEYILTPKGLNYGHMPKGLILFHRYQGKNRTAFEEHLVEAAEYVRDAGGNCRLHFTVSPEHLEDFRTHLGEVKSIHEQRLGVAFEVEFSVQSPSTNTIAVDMDNRPFRLDDGRILFRPGGHGALLENLNRTGGDIIYIKNIDNVVPDWFKGPTYLWKKILAGVLLEIQSTLFDLVERLQCAGPSESLVDDALEFAMENLNLVPPDRWPSLSREDKRNFIVDRLNRPLRVCGMVPNQGEPGGGPFWVESRDGTPSVQIVESAQVDHSSPEQERIWESATHFNPVDLVCSVRDYRGVPFDLRRYVDKDTVIITRKSQQGRDLKALELPGLWNGAMAYWNSVLVEVPLETFNPVKTVLDLLRPAHQPPQDHGET